MCARLQRVAIEARHAVPVQFERSVFKAQMRNVWASPSRCEDVFIGAIDIGSVGARKADPHAVLDCRRGLERTLRLEVKRFGKRRTRLLHDHRVRQRAHAAACAKHAHLHAKARQRLAELQPDHTRANHRHAARQRLPGEHVVVHDDALAHAREYLGHAGGRTGRDHHARRMHERIAADLQHPVVDEVCVTNQPVRFWQRVDAIHDEADEAIALAAHALHYRLAVYPHALDPHAKRVRMTRGMRGFRRRDQQLRRHAPHSPHRLR